MRRYFFMNEKNGMQTIGCEVTSCKYHSNNACDLSGIMVKPCCDNVNTGNPADETLCGSYAAK